MRVLRVALPVLAALFLGGAGWMLPGCSSGDPSWSDAEKGGGMRAALGDYFASVHGFTLDDIRWGDLHGHSRYSYDAPLASTPEEALQYAMDPRRGDLDFVCLSEHAEMPPAKQCPPEDADLWQSLRRISREYSNEDPAAGRPFIVFPGWEYTNTRGLAPLFGSDTGYGHKVVLFKDFDPIPPTRTAAWGIKGSGTDRIARTARELWQDLAAWRPASPGTEGTVLTIPHTTSMKGIGPPQDHRTDWEVMDPDFVRHVEIISKWGNTEGPPPAEEGCVLDDTSSLVDYDAGEQDTSITTRVLLHRKWVVQGDPSFRLAFVGGTDNHAGQPGNWEERQWGTDLALEHRGGVTGIVATEITRDALWSALWTGRTLASHSGPYRPRVLVAVETGGQQVMMGGHAAHDGSARLRVLGGEEVERLEVVLDGCLYESVESATLDQEIHLSPGRHYLYVHASRQDGEVRSVAWSSPVYLDRPASPRLDASILSAYLGLLDASAFVARALERVSGCDQQAGDDAMPVVFSVHLDASSIRPEDFAVHRASGGRATPTCATLEPATGADERRTVLLTGPLGTASDPPTRVDLVGEITATDVAGVSLGLLHDLRSPPVRYAEEGPVMVLAIHWVGGELSRCTGGEVRIQTTWCGGVKGRGRREFRDRDLAGFTIAALDEQAGVSVRVTPLRFEDLDDGDNHLDLCIAPYLIPVSVEVAEAVAFDPTGQPNPAHWVPVELR